MAVRNWFQWVDVGGNTRITRFDSDPLFSGAARLAIQNVSNGGLIAVTSASVGGPYTEPGLGVFAPIKTAAALTYQDGLGESFNVYIPAPFDSLFLSDNITVGGVVWAAVNAVLLNALYNPANGLPAQAFIGGIRVGGNSGY